GAAPPAVLLRGRPVDLLAPVVVSHRACTPACRRCRRVTARRAAAARGAGRQQEREDERADGHSAADASWRLAVKFRQAGWPQPPTATRARRTSVRAISTL